MSLMIRNRGLLVLCLLVVVYNTYSCSTGLGDVNIAVRVIWIILSAFVVTAVFIGLMLVMHLLVVLSGKHVGIVGEHTLEIKEDGMEESTAVNKSLHRWNPSFRITEFGPYVWIYPIDSQFFIISKSPQYHQGDLAGFLALLKTRMNQPAA